MLETTKILNSKGLGQQIKARRKKLGYTQIELAQACKCSPRFIGELERGIAGGNIKQVIKICHSIGLDLYIKPRSD